MQKHLEDHGRDCDNVGIFVISFFNMILSFVNDLSRLLSILFKSLPGVYSDVCIIQVSFDYIFVSQPLSTVNS